VAGTTGYDFMNLVNGVLVDPTSSEPFRRLYQKFVGGPPIFKDVVVNAKKFILLTSMASELRVLSTFLDRISEQHRWSRDFTQESLRFALREVVACFPVYRSYIRADASIDEADRQLVNQAISEAKIRNPATTESIFDFIESVLLLQ
jgi:(1->4)-alpha-D-glucan 1-alpha-D-glucosylmutase